MVSSPPRRPLGRKLLVLASTLVALFAIGEVALRLADHDPVDEKYKGVQFLIQRDEVPEIGYRLIPNAAVDVWDVPVHINSLGFRGPEVTRAKPPGVFRILAVGDSVTFGPGLTDEETWPAMLQQRYGDRDLNTEVINLGVPGYDTAQEVALVREVGAGLEPDQVILCFCINDVATVTFDPELVEEFERFGSGLLSWSRCAQQVALLLKQREVAAKGREFAAEENAALAELPLTPDPELDRMIAELERAMEAAGEPQTGPDKINRKQRLVWYVEPARLQRVRNAYADLAELAREHGFGVTVFVSPMIREGLDVEGWRTTYRMVQHLAEDAGFDFVDVYPDLEALGWKNLYTKPKDAVHINALAHREMARVLARETRGWFFQTD